MFAGSFNQMHFGEVARLLSSSKQSGVLIIIDQETNHLLASVYFHGGQLVHATADQQSGLDALNQICHMGQASFSFENDVSPPEQSLITYPTERLLEKVHKEVIVNGAFQAALPLPADIPVYQPGKSMMGLQASPDELALLIQCKGQSTINQIAAQMNLNVEDVCRTLGKFQHVGMIKTGENHTTESVEAAQDISESDPSAPNQLPQATQSTTNQPARYWRGKRIS
ncbi:MAG: DUF4388 domain-containing protein [Verrucomicrobiota bacterium]